jgi:hypothetical protein
MSNEFGKDMKGSDRRLMWSTTIVFTWRDWEKSSTFSAARAGVGAQIWTPYSQLMRGSVNQLSYVSSDTSGETS